MTTQQLCIRNLPEKVAKWVDDTAHSRRESKNAFVVSVLEQAMETDRDAEQQLPLDLNEPAARVRGLCGLPPFAFIDLFAGIGGMRLGLEEAGGQCRFSSEWDRHCQKTYLDWFDELPVGDIRAYEGKKLDEIPDHDVLAAGFPCQPFSIAGVSKKKSLGREHGFRDRTQGTLFFHLATIIEAKRPPVVLLENVKNLRSHDQGRTWKVITEALGELGYEVFSAVIDAAGWVPQHRERVFLVCFDRSVFGGSIPFKFPEPPASGRTSLCSILEQDPDRKYRLSDRLWAYLQAYAEKHRQKGNGFGFGLANPNGITRTLSARYFKDGSEILIPTDGNPRRLTPREAARLMGFPDRLPIVVSDTQAYRQFGNAVVPSVVAAVGRSIGRVLSWHLMRRGGGTLLGEAGDRAVEERSASIAV